MFVEIIPGLVGSCKASGGKRLAIAGARVIFTGRMPFLSPNQQCISTERVVSEAASVITD